MNLLNTKSLAATVENLNDALFNDIIIPKTEKISIAKWIASRQGAPRSYANMFAPMSIDFTWGVNLFTGEKILSAAGVSYYLGQDCCRLLIKMDVKDNKVQTALADAVKGITERINFYDGKKGFYCCCRCSTVYWHYLATDIDKNADLLKAGMKILKSCRIGDGKWRRFPYWHTLFILTELPPQISGEEIKYALPASQRMLTLTYRFDKLYVRRRKIAQKAMQLCE